MMRFWQQCCSCWRWAGVAPEQELFYGILSKELMGWVMQAWMITKYCQFHRSVGLGAHIAVSLCMNYTSWLPGVETALARNTVNLNVTHKETARRGKWSCRYKMLCCRIVYCPVPKCCCVFRELVTNRPWYWMTFFWFVGKSEFLILPICILKQRI